METKVNLYKEIKRSGNDVELVGKTRFAIAEAEYVNAESILQQNLVLNHMTLGQNKSTVAPTPM